MSVGNYSICHQPYQGGTFIYRLSGSGNPSDLVRLIRKACRELAKPLVIAVDFDNKNMEKLMKLYARIGFTHLSVLMELN
jgi:hypothetical protein